MNRYEKLAGRVVKAISDLPFPVEKSEEDRMEAELDVAIAQLGKELKAGKKGYYGEPGRTICVNVAMMGALNFWELSLGRIGWDAKRGVLSVNPGWHTPRMGGKETLSSYEWPSILDKVLGVVRNSEPVYKMVVEMLDKAELGTGVKISDDKRREIIKFVEQSAMRRMGVHQGFMSGGKEFQIVDAMVVASKTAGIYDMVADVSAEEMAAEFAKFVLRHGVPSMVSQIKAVAHGAKVMISGEIHKTEHAVAYPKKEGSSVGIEVVFSSVPAFGVGRAEEMAYKGRADMKLWIDGRHVDGNADVSRPGDELERWVANVASTVGQMVYVNAG